MPPTAAISQCPNGLFLKFAIYLLTQSQIKTHAATVHGMALCKQIVALIKTPLSENPDRGITNQKGLEPSTSGVTGRRSNHLSYWSSADDYIHLKLKCQAKFASTQHAVNCNINCPSK